MVPLKHSACAKQRLVGVGSWRPALAIAFATDVLTALLDSDHVREVVVVGGEGLPPGLLTGQRVHRLPDVRGLNAAVEAGIRAARRSADVGVLVLPADLPCLRPEDVATVVATSSGHRATALADSDGEGTVALVVPPGVDIRPAFGPGSYARHLQAGALPVGGDLSCARRDVDTLEHLAAARDLGLGTQTTRVLAELEASQLSER